MNKLYAKDFAGLSEDVDDMLDEDIYQYNSSADTGLYDEDDNYDEDDFEEVDEEQENLMEPSDMGFEEYD